MKADGSDVECLHCGRCFRPKRRGHVFCRHQGELPPKKRIFAGEAVERLFDPSRDPKELVTREDWHPSRALADDDAAWIELDLSSTVESRRRWYRNLLDDPVFGGPKV